MEIINKSNKQQQHNILDYNVTYRECMKNHAANIGGHAVDGCCEFTPSINAQLSCQACGCHRNFHRKHQNHLHHHHRPHVAGEESDELRRVRRRLGPAATPAEPPPAGTEHPKRKSRTKFTSEQKMSMHELAERLNWRMPKRDVDGVVDRMCKKIGVNRGVFKVWMHNNKQSFGGYYSSAAVTMSSMSLPVFPLRANAGDSNGESKGCSVVNVSSGH